MAIDTLKAVLSVGYDPIIFLDTVNMVATRKSDKEEPLTVELVGGQENFDLIKRYPPGNYVARPVELKKEHLELMPMLEMIKRRGQMRVEGSDYTNNAIREMLDNITPPGFSYNGKYRVDELFYWYHNYCKEAQYRHEKYILERYTVEERKALTKEIEEEIDYTVVITVLYPK